MMIEWHDEQRVCSTDSWFVLGGNPNEDGGGVIASTTSEFKAMDIKAEAVKRGYRNVVIVSATDFWCLKEEER